MQRLKNKSRYIQIYNYAYTLIQVNFRYFKNSKQEAL